MPWLVPWRVMVQVLVRVAYVLYLNLALVIIVRSISYSRLWQHLDSVKRFYTCLTILLGSAVFVAPALAHAAEAVLLKALAILTAANA